MDLGRVDVEHVHLGKNNTQNRHRFPNVSDVVDIDMPNSSTPRDQVVVCKMMVMPFETSRWVQTRLPKGTSASIRRCQSTARHFDMGMNDIEFE